MDPGGWLLFAFLVFWGVIPIRSSSGASCVPRFHVPTANGSACMTMIETVLFQRQPGTKLHYNRFTRHYTAGGTPHSSSSDGRGPVVLRIQCTDVQPWMGKQVHPFHLPNWHSSADMRNEIFVRWSLGRRRPWRHYAGCKYNGAKKLPLVFVRWRRLMVW